MQNNTKKLVVLAMLSAIAFLLAAYVRVPVVLFLSYDPKDIIITIGGFIYGFVPALLISVVVSFVEMVTVSPTGFWGMIMNILGSVSFCCTAAFIYERNRSAKGAAIGLTAGFVLSTAVMMLWNYLIVPIYTDWPREQVVELLIPAFLPFNLIQRGLNAAFTVLLYKRIKSALQAAKLLPEYSNSEALPAKYNPGLIIAALVVLITCVLWLLTLRDII